VTTAGQPMEAPASPTGFAGAGRREPTRACSPDDQGYVDRAGVRIAWERYGSDQQAVVLLPTWEIAHYPRVRDRSIFVGEPDDIVTDSFGDGLPPIREWTEQHFSVCGHITGFDAAQLAGHSRLRAELGYAPDEQVCIVTVGGSGVGAHLLRSQIPAVRASAVPTGPHRVARLRTLSAPARHRAASAPGRPSGRPAPA
jgi:hypothetical protein